MRFITDRCVECGSPIRPTNLKHKHLDTTGLYPGTAFWFCSPSCFDSALSEYIPAEFQRPVEQSPGYKELVKTFHPDLPDHREVGSFAYRRCEDYIHSWDIKKDTAVRFDAPAELNRRLSSEYFLQASNVVEDQIVDMRKEHKRIDAIVAKADQTWINICERADAENRQFDADQPERIEKERKRMEREETQKQRELNYQEDRARRQAKDIEREREKQQKLDQEKAAAEAEEKRWLPKIFKI